MSRLRDMGFRTFTDVIPNFYENFDYCAEEAFQCLDRLWNSNRYRSNPGLLLEDLRDDLEHNYSLLIEIANQHRDKSIELGGLKYFGNQ